MMNKKGSEGADAIIIAVVFIIVIVLGSIGIFATQQFEVQKEIQQEEVVYHSLFSYHLSQYMIQPLGEPRKYSFEKELSEVLEVQTTRQNQALEIKNKKDVSDIIDDFHSQYLPSKTCWELRVDGKKIVENKESCLLRHTYGISSVRIPIASSIENVELIIR